LNLPLYLNRIYKINTKLLPPLKILIGLFDFHYKEGHITHRFCGDPYYFDSNYREIGNHNNNINERAFNSITNEGYLRGICNKSSYTAHRLLYYTYYGIQPSIIDHIDQNPSNNCITNLRPANTNINTSNRSNNTKGIRLRDNGKYEVKINNNSKQIYLGVYESKIKAIKAREQYIKEHNLDKILYLER